MITPPKPVIYIISIGTTISKIRTCLTEPKYKRVELDDSDASATVSLLLMCMAEMPSMYTWRKMISDIRPGRDLDLG